MTFSNRKKILIIIFVIALALIFSFRQNILILGSNIMAFNPDFSNELILEMDSKTIATENQRLKSILANDDFSIYMPVIISEGYSVNGYRISPETASNVINKYSDFLNSEHKDEVSADYSKNVSLIVWFSGQSQKALDIIESISLDDESEETNDEINIIKSGFYLSLLDFDRVSENIGKTSGSKYDYLKDLINNSLKNFTDPQSSYIFDANKTYEKTELDKYFEELLQYSQSKKYEVKKSGNKISGYITDGENPMQGVPVYISISRGFSSSRDFENYTVTDENGYYEIDGFNYEKVRLRLQIPWHRLLNKQIKSDYNQRKLIYSDEIKELSRNFEFFDAAKIKSIKIENDNLLYEIYDPKGNENRIYYLYARSSSSENINPIRSNIAISYKNLKGSIPLDKLRSGFDIPYLRYGYGKDLILEDFIEPLYLEDDYIFNINIASADSNFYISNGFFSNHLGEKIHIESPYTLSEGDKLIDNNELEKAIKWFENNESEHGYKVLAALYSRGYIIDPKNESSFDRGGKNLEKALIYKKKLYELDPENIDRLADLIWTYNDLKMYDEEHKLIIKSIKYDNSVYSHFLLAKNEILRGNLMTGINIYLDYADPIRDYDRYFSYLFLSNETKYLSKTYLKHFDNFELDGFKEFFLFMKNGEYEKGYKWLEEKESSEPHSKDLVKFYMLLYLDSFSKNDFDDFIQYYVEKTNELEDDNLKWILKELKYNSNWF